jgi:peptidoglycan hydrolase-like protein with peptidoglycan-binding domain
MNTPRPEGNLVNLSRRLPPIDTTMGIQRRLNQTGFNAGPEDDIYGPKTTAAVMRFQQYCKFNAGGDNPRIIDAGPVDGIAGPLTQAALLQFYGS